MSENYGYVRVSTKDQHTDRQITAMRDHGIDKENVFVDIQSGKNFERPKYQQMLQSISKGDCIYIISIDRLGRNYEDIRNQWTYIVKELQVDIVVLDMPILDTRTGKDLIGTFLSDIVLQVLSFVAENERNNIRKRQAEGIQAAKNRGVQFGRPRKPLPEGFDRISKMYLEGVISGISAAQQLGIPPCRFYRLIRYYKT